MTGYRYIDKVSTTDIITVLYIVVTAVYMLVFGRISEELFMPILIRGVLVIQVGIIIFMESKRETSVIKFIHLFYPILLLTYFYSETAQLNHFIFNTNFDSIIYGWEDALFGFQPSIDFSARFPQHWFSELLHFGYFSYYLLTIGVGITFYILRPDLAEKVIFMIVTSFYIYYLVFIIFPVIGPQYYYAYPLNEVVYTGIFSQAVKLVQYYGEHPTGAFPSSHVGMVLIFLYLSYKNIRWLFWVIVPLFVLILMATVYLKAHYAVDVVAGIFSAPIVYFISNMFYGQIRDKLNQLT
ncbi:MAG: phosphatase PAP2 family protein [Bacteroidetes bacterium]|nr:phosphatase PAP2 family protein [Bacteroidota bacterium]